MYSFDFIGELLKKGKRFAVSYIVAECLENRDSPENSLLLHHVAEYLLNPTEKINKADVIEWIRWLLGAGKNPDEFGKEVVKYDTATTCGLVWIANFVAYRCRTCAISPCMSLCAECFQKGEHDGHDFNMFRSLAGGKKSCLLPLSDLSNLLSPFFQHTLAVQPGACDCG